MLKSQARYTPFFKSLAVFCFLLLITIPVYVEAVEPEKPESDYILNPNIFTRLLFLFTGIALLVWIFLKSKSKSLVILEDRIEIKPFLKPKRHFLLKEIVEIEWGSGGKRPAVPVFTNLVSKASHDGVLIVLKDKRYLYFDIGEYSNFEELRTWFLNYGRKEGIIAVRPLEERKRSRKR
ncbi:MAG: hypothetical protein K0S12_1625 [Bacteroidetes bacterium]|jgi:hypothetical protein|nr:hypothetical protein [Bacteroidota bacterium]